MKLCSTIIMDNNLFSSCHNFVTSGKVQGSELSLDMLLLSAAATRQVIMGYKCEHEGCQKSFESTKRHNVHRQRNCGKSYETSSSGANSFRAARRMLSAQSFISSPLSTRGIKVRITRICENRSCEYLQILRKSANYIRKISCISQQNLLAKVQQNVKHFADFRLYSHYPP